MNDAQSMSTEIEIMKRVRHRNVCNMYELYETPKCLWMVLEVRHNEHVKSFRLFGLMEFIVCSWSMEEIYIIS